MQEVVSLAAIRPQHQAYAHLVNGRERRKVDEEAKFVTQSEIFVPSDNRWPAAAATMLSRRSARRVLPGLTRQGTDR